jgi:hypothetical protein
MTDFNPATMNPASIILPENFTNNNCFDYIIVLIIIILCFFIYLKLKKN